MKHKDKVVHSPSQENVIYCAKKSFSNLNFIILKEKVYVSVTMTTSKCSNVKDRNSIFYICQWRNPILGTRKILVFHQHLYTSNRKESPTLFWRLARVGIAKYITDLGTNASITENKYTALSFWKRKFPITVYIENANDFDLCTQKAFLIYDYKSHNFYSVTFI